VFRQMTRFGGGWGDTTSLLRVIRQNALLLVFMALSVIFTLLSPHFASTNNILLILMRTAPLAVVVAGQTLVIISGGIDLSVGSVAGLTSIIAAKLMVEKSAVTLPPYLAIGAALLVATLIGWVQGWLITRRELSPFIVTFGSLSLIKGMALVYSDAASIPIPHAQFSWMWRVGPSPRPVPIALMVLVFAALWYVLRNTKLGRYTIAIGSSETVVRMSGVNVARYKTQVYMVSSFLAGLSGIMLMTRIEIGSYTNGEDYPLTSIAAAVIGGASLQGGIGSAWGSLLGVLLLTMVNVGLGILNVSSLWATAVTGGLIVLAALADVERRKAQEAVPPVRPEKPTGNNTYLLQLCGSLRRAIRQHLAGEYVRFYLIDRESGDLIEQGNGDDHQTILGQPSPLIARVQQTLVPVWVGNLHQDDELSTIPIKPDLQSAIAVPILRASYLVGIVELQSPYGDVFNDTTVERLTEIVAPAAGVLEDAWLLESGWLLRHTREALRHLWDEVYLSRCQLADWAYALTETHPTARGQDLQQLLLDTIEVVGQKEAGENPRDRRNYQILHLTYVDGLAVEEITEKLSVSRRQYFYNLKEALEKVVHYLMNRDTPPD
jgi:ribose/xylose/arabinose/galactoside ABC-type transport system permease subunit/putative methionine-R-sulfoxide reductase with GAF domain